MHPSVHSSTIYNSQAMEATQVSTNSQTILLSHKKKNDILSFAVMWMNLENFMLSEINQKERQILHAITYMWTLKNNTNKWIKQN